MHRLPLRLTCNTSINTTREVWELFPHCRRCGTRITESDVMQQDPETPFRVMHYKCPVLSSRGPLSGSEDTNG